jgi:hypothetical protein
MVAGSVAGVTIRRHNKTLACEVVVAFRNDEMSVRCRTYDQAVKWARVECKSYGVADFAVESEPTASSRSPK